MNQLVKNCLIGSAIGHLFVFLVFLRLLTPTTIESYEHYQKLKNQEKSFTRLLSSDDKKNLKNGEKVYLSMYRIDLGKVEYLKPYATLMKNFEYKFKDNMWWGIAFVLSISLMIYFSFMYNGTEGGNMNNFLEYLAMTAAFLWDLEFIGVILFWNDIVIPV